MYNPPQGGGYSPSLPGAPSGQGYPSQPGSYPGQGYAPQGAYPAQPGSYPGQGYPPQGAHPAQPGSYPGQGYPPQGAFPAQPGTYPGQGYPPQGAFPAQPGTYPGQGYPPQGAFPAQPGTNPGQGYPPQGAFPAQPGTYPGQGYPYPQSGAFPSQGGGGYPSAGGYATAPVGVQTTIFTNAPPGGFQIYAQGVRVSLRTSFGRYIVAEDGGLRSESQHHGTCCVVLCSSEPFLSCLLLSPMSDIPRPQAAVAPSSSSTFMTISLRSSASTTASTWPLMAPKVRLFSFHHI